MSPACTCTVHVHCTCMCERFIPKVENNVSCVYCNLFWVQRERERESESERERGDGEKVCMMCVCVCMCLPQPIVTFNLFMAASIHVATLFCYVTMYPTLPTTTYCQHMHTLTCIFVWQRCRLQSKSDCWIISVWDSSFFSFEKDAHARDFALLIAHVTSTVT